MEGIAIDTASAVAPFEQLRVQLREQVSTGRLAAGAKLPTVRRLADELGLAVNTVARSYRELEADGIIETRGRAGSFVAAQGDVVEQQGQKAARDYADRIHKLGIDPETAIAWVKAALRP